MDYTGKKGLMPLVSVIVPVYNSKPYLKRCIDSIITQTYKNIEVILIDDGSIDGSSEMCDLFQKLDNRIVVIHKNNGGVVSARKAGIERATGEYATYVDSDDWIESDMYEKLMSKLIQVDADIVTSGMYRDYSKSIVTEYDRISEGVYDREKIENEIVPIVMYTGDFFVSGINMHIYNKIFKRELLLNHQLELEDSIRVGEDASVVYSCILNASTIIITHNCFYHYCIRQDSVMSTGYQNELKGYQEIYRIILRCIKKHNQKQELLVKQLNYLMIYLFSLKEPQMIIKNKDNFLLPFGDVKINDRVVLYGGGKFGCTLKRYLEESGLCRVVLWIDKVADCQRNILEASKIKEVSKETYDKIIIAVLVKSVASEIQKELLQHGINKSKIAIIKIEYDEIVGGDEWKLLFGV